MLPYKSCRGRVAHSVRVKSGRFWSEVAWLLMVRHGNGVCVGRAQDVGSVFFCQILAMCLADIFLVIRPSDDSTMNHIFRKVTMMLDRLRRIFGVPDDPHTAAGRTSPHPRQVLGVPDKPKYQPALALSESQINGVGADGDCWTPWRVSAIDGEQWYVRTSSLQGVAQSPAIAGELSPDFDDALDGELDPLTAFRREVAILKNLNSYNDDLESGEIIADDECGEDTDE